MRLTPHQITVFKSVAAEVFGSGAQVALFGSRADDMRRGGDIDLYISGVVFPFQEQVDAKLRFLVKAKQQIGDQRIDVVIAPSPGQAVLPIHQIAQQTGGHYDCAKSSRAQTPGRA
jgi:hypothetical protein